MTIDSFMTDSAQYSNLALPVAMSWGAEDFNSFFFMQKAVGSAGESWTRWSATWRRVPSETLGGFPQSAGRLAAARRQNRETSWRSVDGLQEVSRATRWPSACPVLRFRGISSHWKMGLARPLRWLRTLALIPIICLWLTGEYPHGRNN